MKTRFKLLVLALVLVVVAFCIVACGDEPADTTTAAPQGDATTTTAATTTAATTTAAPTAGNIHPECLEMELTTTTQNYSGKAITNGYAVSDRPTFVKVSYTFKMIDPVTGAVLEDLGDDKPVKSGTYEVTASFDFQRNAKEEDRAYNLPEPMTARLIVAAGTLGDKLAFGAKDYEIYYKASGLSFDPATSPIATGVLPTGLSRAYSVVKLAGKDDTSAGTAVAEAGKITSADGAGYFRVTVSYVENEGEDNWTNEDTTKHEAIVYVREITKQVKKANPIIDGEIDPEYRASASYTTKYQDHEVGTGNVWNLLGDEIVNPFEFAAMLKMSAGASVTSVGPQTTATFYVLWGEEGGEAYIYVAAEITDTTPYARSSEYTSKPNAWINDSLELYYHFGADVAPDMTDLKDTYPTYNAVIRDSVTGKSVDAGDKVLHNAVAAQTSVYFSEIKSAVKGRDTAGDTTYVVEYRFPAKSESFLGTNPGDDDFTRLEGETIGAGDFIYLACQINDLTGLPEGYDTIEQYDAQITDNNFPANKYPNNFTYSPDKASPWFDFENKMAPFMSCYGNRGAYYLKLADGAPMVFQLSDETATFDIDATDGVKDADYASGSALEFAPVDEEGEDIANPDASLLTDIETVYIQVGNKLYIYTAVDAAAGSVKYYINNSIIFTVDASGVASGSGAASATVAAGNGFVHEIVVELANDTPATLTADVTGVGEYDYFGE